MESGKQGSSETSSDENDRQEEIKEETGGGSVAAAPSAAKRSYECTFCKRGFTNAQALGGHMNIHRKDRAKAKQTDTASSVSRKLAANEEYMTNPNFGGPIPSERGEYHPVLESQNSHHVMNYHQSWGSSPTQPLGVSYYPGSHEFLVPRPQSALSINYEEIWGANLSLQINSSSTHVEDSNDSSEVKTLSKGDEVDLELRLGHSPSYRQPH